MRRLHLSRTLNDSQKRHAARIGISISDYQVHVLNRLEEMGAKALPKTFRDPKMKRTKIKAENPVLIVGDGDSLSKNIEQIRNFKGTKIFCDVVVNKLVKLNIIPDYILTLETVVRTDMFKLKYLELCKGKTKMICSASTSGYVTDQNTEVGLSFSRWISKNEPRFANVGTFSVVYAKEVLKADKIFLVGFEHDGVSENKNTYEYWCYDFWFFVNQWPKETIVNCTDGGQLYYGDYILDSTLDSLV